MVGDKPYAVAVVVNPAFGGRLSDLASCMHVWCIDTSDNRAAAEILWHQNEQAQTIERGVTIFSADPTDPPDEIVASELGTIDLHHGDYSHVPPYSVLHVYGAKPTSVLREALAGLGFVDVVLTAEGFDARRE